MLIEPSNIKIEDYIYNLPSERIALYPLEKRDSSKLLIFKEDKISEDVFLNITRHLPSDTLLIFNQTKVIQARIKFKKTTGSEIEVFCLDPVNPHSDLHLAFQQQGCCQWNCLVGNAKRWKEGNLIKQFIYNDINVELKAIKIKTLPSSDNQPSTFIIEFNWSPENLPFSVILETAGLTPLPPYINREAQESDKTKYQTIYAMVEGSVAAPTAGLHFTKELMENIKVNGIIRDYVTLHINTGTFQPVTATTIDKHLMHEESFLITKSSIENIINNLDKFIIPVGTTSLRTIESLYWLGVKLINENENINDNNSKIMMIDQWEPYYDNNDKNISAYDSLKRILEHMDENKLEMLEGATKIIIVPGYKFRITNGLITNFHQPKSTLLLLVASLIGDKMERGI